MFIAHLRERIREVQEAATHARNANPAGASPVDNRADAVSLAPLVDHPDQCGIIPLTGTCACGRCGTGIAVTVLAERRQVVEVVDPA